MNQGSTTFYFWHQHSGDKFINFAQINFKMKVTFVKTPKPKRFTYPPRYYDEEKERLEQRKRDLGLSEDGKSDFRAQVSNNWKRFRKSDQTRKKRAEVSVLIYLIIVAILVYFVFFV